MPRMYLRYISELRMKELKDRLSDFLLKVPILFPIMFK
jgi:hypothetical protein